ncbi:MAG: cation-translocating P-type ATPase [Chlamydiae bacterium]|nr:cation-translocating P-type ATPase [Chlamydiota bacterium]
MAQISYKIQELDCAEEAAILKKTLSPHSGILDIKFDILDGKMSVTYDPKIIDSEKIFTLIHSTGMTASLWQERKKVKIDTRKKGPLFALFFSGISLFIGLFFHYKLTEHLADIFGIGEKPFPTPLFAKLFYLLAIAFGTIYVAPKAFKALKRMQADMNLLMLIAIVGAMFIDQWFEAASVAFLFSLALFLQSWSVERAKKAISSLLDLSPQFARIIVNETELVEKKIEEVREGEKILIRPGERIPLDAIVEKGISSVNQASITGESMPISKNPGDHVYAGSINEEGALECIVNKSKNETILAQIIKTVESARARRAKSEEWVEKFAHFYTPIMIAFAIMIATIPALFFQFPWNESIYRGLVLLVIACPCALVISTPVTIVSALTSSARQGILVKSGLYLELMGKAKAIAFDKTGTLTKGKPQVQKIIPLQGYSDLELLEIAATLEKLSEHPLARAILKAAKEKKIETKLAKNFKIIKGLGAEAEIGKKSYWIGSHRLMHEKGQETEEIHQTALQLEDAGHSIIAIGNEEQVLGLISVADEPKKFARETILAIRELGIKKIILITGDNEPTAKALAQEVMIEDVRAELFPEDKIQIIEELMRQDQIVCMVGDGINDAPAMAAANIGIAMGETGTDLAFETADIVLMSDELSQIPILIRKSRKALKIIQQNISFSLGLKGIILLLSIFGLTNLWMAIGADTGASLLVIFNGLRLLKT